MDFFWPLSIEWCDVIFWNSVFTSMYTCEHGGDYIKLGDLCFMVISHAAPPLQACFCNLHNDVWITQLVVSADLRVGSNFLSAPDYGRPIPPCHLSSAGSCVACLLSPEGKLTPAHQMHSFKTCANSFDHLNGLASIDVFSAPLCEGRSLAKLPHLEHMSPGVWTESNSAGTHNEVLSSLSKVSSWFIPTSYKKV